MLKRVVTRPDWLAVGSVVDLYSASSCFSKSLVENITVWEFNGLGLVDRPGYLDELAAAHDIDTRGMALFYYEIFEHQYDEDLEAWTTFHVDADPEPPVAAQLEGFDIATYTCGFGAECSPLSCNSMAAELPVNRHCLFESFEAAKSAIDSGVFEDCEPGPYRILAVYSVPRVTG